LDRVQSIEKQSNLNLISQDNHYIIQTLGELNKIKANTKI